MTSSYQYVIAYKPYNTLTIHRGQEGQTTLADLGIPQGLHPAGRLDLDSEGLLLLSDDGELIHRVTHPAHHHAKTYLVCVLGQPDDDALHTLRHGVEIKLGQTRPADVEVLRTAPTLPPLQRRMPAEEKTAWLRIVLREGKNRQIRRMTAAVGHATVRLVRVAIGPLALPADLQPGQWRELTFIERQAVFTWLWPRGRREKRSH